MNLNVENVAFRRHVIYIQMFCTRVKLSKTCVIYLTFTFAATCFLSRDHGKKRMRMNCNICFQKLIKQLGWHIWKKHNLYKKLKLCKKIKIPIILSKKIYCSNISTLPMQFFFFYIRKTTTCVVLGDEDIDGNFGCGVLQVVKGVIIHCKFS